MLHSCRSADLPEVSVKQKDEAVVLTPSLAGLVFVSTELAPREIEPVTRNNFTIRLDFKLEPCHSNDRFVWARPSQRLHKQIVLDTHFLPQSIS
jgi:hypothetical protein